MRTAVSDAEPTIAGASGRAGAGTLRAGALRTGSLRARTVVAVLVLLAVLLGALCVAVESTLGDRLRAQIEDRLHDRAAAAAALVGTVDADDLADRLSMQGLSVRITTAAGSVEAGPTPEQLRKGPPDPGGLPGPARPGGTTSSTGTGPAGRTAGSGTAAASSGSGASDGAVGSGAAAGSGTAAGDAATSGTAAAAGRVHVTSSRITEDGRVVTLVSRLSDGSTIRLATGTGQVEAVLVELRWVMAAACAGFMLLAAVGLLLVVRRTMRPLDEVSATARSIARGDRGRRLRPARRGTEIGRVADAFDEMLDAVEGAEQRALDAEARMRAFLSDAAHELRTPVAGIRAAADTLVRAPVGPAEREDLAVHVVRQAGRASRLVDDLLLMARMDRGLGLDRTPVDLGALARTEADRIALRAPDLRVLVSEPDGPVVVHADADRVGQLLGNLLENASRATGSRGIVQVRVAAADHPLAGAEPRDGRRTTADRGAMSGSWFAGSADDTPDAAAGAVLQVTDDGPGIPEADRERVFERLVRLDAARDDRSGGAGLGLPIARGIARAHGGELVCPPGRETVFTLTLPVGAALAGESTEQHGGTGAGEVRPHETADVAVGV